MKNKIALLLVAGLFLVVVAACGSAATPTPTQVPPTVAPTQIPPTVAPTQVPPTTAPTAAATTDVARPSNPGGAGTAIDLTGDSVSGKKIFDANCVACHGQDGKGGITNPGSDDGTVPPLNPIDDTLKSSDYKTYATNIDLFVEHGSTPAGSSPALLMKAFGDTKQLTPQQIADVISYVISLNK